MTHASIGYKSISALEDATQTAVAISSALKRLYSSSNSNLDVEALHFVK
ncbi:MAG: hypothetical protein ACLRTR_03170 [Clostridia bacterium]